MRVRKNSKGSTRSISAAGRRRCSPFTRSRPCWRRSADAFRVLPDSEITIEVNPADWGRDDLVALRDLGINRISVGVQSLDEKELVFLGRRHSSPAGHAHHGRRRRGRFHQHERRPDLRPARADSFEGWQDSLAGALRFGPAHLSCYELELKPHTPLGLQYERGELEPRTEDSLRDFFMRTSVFLEDAGYLHYEISSFAAGMDKASRHNRKYWDHTPYLGLGPSAHSFRGAAPLVEPLIPGRLPSGPFGREAARQRLGGPRQSSFAWRPGSWA